MIDFYTFSTVNGKAVAITLAATRLPHQVHWVDLMQYEQRRNEYLAINPSGRIPVIVDHDHKPPLMVHQTGAILTYLAEKSGQFGGQGVREAAQIQSWLWFQLTDVSINFFNNFYLKSLIKPPHPAAADILKQRAMGFYAQFNTQLGQTRFIASDGLSIADMAAYPVVDALGDAVLHEGHPNLSRWYQQMKALPAVQTGMQVSSAKSG